MGEEESSFTLFQVPAAVAGDLTKRPKDNCLLCKNLSKIAQGEHALSHSLKGRGEGIEVIALGRHIRCQ